MCPFHQHTKILHKIATYKIKEIIICHSSHIIYQINCKLSCTLHWSDQNTSHLMLSQPPPKSNFQRKKSIVHAQTHNTNNFDRIKNKALYQMLNSTLGNSLSYSPSEVLDSTSSNNCLSTLTYYTFYLPSLVCVY